jgi:hypothetical protein
VGDRSSFEQPRFCFGIAADIKVRLLSEPVVHRATPPQLRVKFPDRFQ